MLVKIFPWQLLWWSYSRKWQPILISSRQVGFIFIIYFIFLFMLSPKKKLIFYKHTYITVTSISVLCIEILYTHVTNPWISSSSFSEDELDPDDHDNNLFTHFLFDIDELMVGLIFKRFLLFLVLLHSRVTSQ